MKTMKIPAILFLALMVQSSVRAAETLGKIVGQLGMVEGEVLVDNRVVSKNAPVREGSTVEVKKGKAILLLGSGSVFHLAADSKMVVKQFGTKADTKKEGGDVDLRFGRTRALILNKGSENKDVRIITRTATMGVRGTEIFIDAPKDVGRPVQFFTLEGLARVEIPQAPAVDVKQNEGYTPSANSQAMSVSDVKAEIKSSGMQVNNIQTPGDLKRAGGEFHTEELPRIPSPRFDPLQDRVAPISVIPHFCNGASGGNCP